MSRRWWWSPNTPRARMRRGLRRAGQPSDDLFDLEPGAGPSTQSRGQSVVEARAGAGRSQLERRSPTRMVVTSFLSLIALGTALLLLPGMHTVDSEERVPFVTALFTATSAICVNGSSMVDTATYWTPLGKVTILLLIQVGGFGIQALGTLWILLLAKRMGATTRLAAMKETGALSPGDVRRMLQALAVVTLLVEVIVAVILTLRFWLGYGYGPGQAAWHGVFHSVSAFNNAGFSLYTYSLSGFSGDPWILVPIMVAIVIGGLGFLVVVELVSRGRGGRALLPQRSVPLQQTYPQMYSQLRARARARASESGFQIAADSHRLGLRNPIPLSLHTRLMLWGTALMMAIGLFGFLLLEWGNPQTLGSMSFGDRLLNAFFSGAVVPRSAGFHTVDVGQMTASTRFLLDGLMFTGGGSGSTAGGVKVTTIMVLLAAALAEVRGQRDVETLDRRIPDSTVRVAVAVLLVSFFTVMAATMLLLTVSKISLDHALFESINALSSTGFSTATTPFLPTLAHLILAALMFLGRVGPVTLASSLMLTATKHHYRLPEGRPMIG